MNKERIVDLLKSVDHKDLHEFCEDLIFAITNDCEEAISKWVSLETLINHITKNCAWD